MLQQQVDAMIEWHVSKRKPAAETSDAVVLELFDWLVQRYGPDIRITERDPMGKHYMFQARHLAKSFYAGMRSSDGYIHMWMLGVTPRSHLLYVTDGLITGRLPDVPAGGTVAVKLDVHTPTTFHNMRFTQTTSNDTDYLVSVSYDPKYKAYFKVALRTILDVGGVGTDEPVEPLTPFQPA